MEKFARLAPSLDRITNFLQLIALLFSIFTRQIYYNNFLALLYMPKYTKSVRKNNMRKNKRGRSRRGGYWFYPGPGDDEHAFTKLKNKFSNGDWKFWQKKPEFVPLAPVSSDYSSAAQEPAMAEEAPMPMPEQAQGSLEYPSPEPAPQAPMDQEPSPMEQEQAPMDNNEAPVETNPETSTAETSTAETPTAEQDLKGGRRRRRSRTTKKRKRSNMRRRTNKRRRSNKRRR